MVSIVATGGLAFNMAYMVIPASVISGTDLSSSKHENRPDFNCSNNCGINYFTKICISIIGTQYMSGEAILLVLAVSILPSSITMNAISKFNNLDKPKKIISIGSIEILTFLLAFFFLVPHYGTLGAAFLHL